MKAFKKSIRKLLRKPQKQQEAPLIKGTNTSIGSGVLIGRTAKVEIGHDTMIAARAIIHTTTHNYNLHPMWNHRIDQPIKIGNHVWIGTGAIILPGVIIEDYAVIGAGSVIAKNVPKGAIMVGNPAKILKYRNLNDLQTDKEIVYPGVVSVKGYKTVYYSK